MTEPWERQEGEPDEEWNAFRSYRDSPPGERSIAGTARTLGKRPESYYKLARAYEWRIRVEAFDRHMDSIETRKTEILLEENAERRIRVGRALQEVALSRLEAWLKDIKGGVIVKLTPADVAKLAEAGIRIERMEMGQSTDNVAILGRVTTMPDDKLMELARRMLNGESGDTGEGHSQV